VAEHPARLAALAKRIGEDIDVLRAAFAEYASTDVGGGSVSEKTAKGRSETWPGPVATAALLDEILAQIQRYVVIHDAAAADICALSVPFAWVHDEAATHSPILVIQAADIESAKTTLTFVLSWLTPQARVIVKPTGPSLYRLVDRSHPTLLLDNGDKLLARDRDLADIVNASWTRGVRIPRTVDGNIYEFDPFCFKIINGVDLLPHLDPATRTRCIVVDLLPKLPEETSVNFKLASGDDRFAILRRKAKRWADDNLAAIKDAEAKMPDGFNGRMAENYALMFTIADLAGGDWPDRARAAAIKLTRRYTTSSLGRQLLGVLYELFDQDPPVRGVASMQLEAALAARSDVWANYQNRGKAINKWGVATLLRPYGITPTLIHLYGQPTQRGYALTPRLEIVFRHYLGKTLPGDRSTVRIESTDSEPKNPANVRTTSAPISKSKTKSHSKSPSKSKE
jgi:putative DNA primase/helicase